MFNNLKEADFQLLAHRLHGHDPRKLWSAVLSVVLTRQAPFYYVDEQGDHMGFFDHVDVEDTRRFWFSNEPLDTVATAESEVEETRVSDKPARPRSTDVLVGESTRHSGLVDSGNVHRVKLTDDGVFKYHHGIGIAEDFFRRLFSVMNPLPRERKELLVGQDIYSYHTCISERLLSHGTVLSYLSEGLYDTYVHWTVPRADKNDPYRSDLLYTEDELPELYRSSRRNGPREEASEETHELLSEIITAFEKAR